MCEVCTYMSQDSVSLLVSKEGLQDGGARCACEFVKITLCDVMLGEKTGSMEGQGGRVVPPSGLLSRWGVPCSLTD